MATATKSQEIEALKHVVRAGTALAFSKKSKDGYVTKEIPATYIGRKTHADFLAYMIDEDGVRDYEMPALTSIRKEMASDKEWTALTNKKEVKLNDIVTEESFVTRTHTGKQYKLLEYEIVSTQKGGL